MNSLGKGQAGPREPPGLRQQFWAWKLHPVLLAQAEGWSLGEMRLEKILLRPVIKMCPAAAFEQSHRSVHSVKLVVQLFLPLKFAFVGFPRQHCVCWANIAFLCSTVSQLGRTLAPHLVDEVSGRTSWKTLAP